jgi:hypothetical protein
MKEQECKSSGAVLEQQEYKSDKLEYDNKDHLDPILLFTAVQGVIKVDPNVVKTTTQEYGVYYVPQRGVGMQGFAFDGSIVSIALRISNMQSVSIIPGEISIPKIDVDTIVQSVLAWMRSWIKGEEDTVKNEDDEDE